MGARTRPRGGERGRRDRLGSRAHTSLRGQTFNSCQVSPLPRLASLGLPLKHEPPCPPPPALRGPRTLRAGAPGAQPQDPLCLQSGCRRKSGWGWLQVLVRGARRLRPRRVAGEGNGARPRVAGGLGFHTLEPLGERLSRGSASRLGATAGFLRFLPGVGKSLEVFFFFPPKLPSKLIILLIT